jgi:hypothetical protein
MGLFKRKKKEQILCPNCAKPVANGSAFCDSCGLRVSPPPACAKCGLPLAPDTNFCESCGTAVGTAPESPATDAPSPIPKGKSSKDRKAKKKALKKDEFVHPAMPVPEEADQETTDADQAPDCEENDTAPEPFPAGIPASAANIWPALPRVSKTVLAIAGIGILCLILASVVLTGLVHLPVLSFMKAGNMLSGPLPAALTPQPLDSPSATEETPGALSLVPGPTQVPPESYRIWLQEERSPITSMVTVIYNGGKGQLAVREVQVRLIRSDGQVLTQAFRPLTAGEGVELQGTKFTDRLQVNITYNNGDTYTVIDRVFPYKQRH